MLPTNYSLTNHINLKHMYEEDLALIKHKCWYGLKYNQPTTDLFLYFFPFQYLYYYVCVCVSVCVSVCLLVRVIFVTLQWRRIRLGQSCIEEHHFPMQHVSYLLDTIVVQSLDKNSRVTLGIPDPSFRYPTMAVYSGNEMSKKEHRDRSEPPN